MNPLAPQGPSMSVTIILVAALFGIAFYFVPTIIAANRKITNTLPLFLVNLLLGWSGVMWLACLVWSLVEQPAAQRRFYERADQGLAPGPPRSPTLPGPYGGAMVSSGPDQSWYYDAGGSQSGPHSNGEMAQLARSGRLRADTLCWTADFGDTWRPISQTAFSSGPPPLRPR
jgi:hypothetical protein